MIWIQTLGGNAFDLIHPTPPMVNFDTIATVLARVPRFCGHTTLGPYSVGQHCEQGARAILTDTGMRDLAAAFLLHDAHEAYIGDISTPVQFALGELCEWPLGIRSAFRTLKTRIDASIYAAAGIDWPLPAETHRIIKSYDLRMLRSERDQRMDAPPRDWGEMAEPIEDLDLWPWSEGTVASLYMAACRELLPVFVDNPQRT